MARPIHVQGIEWSLRLPFLKGHGLEEPMSDAMGHVMNMKKILLGIFLIAIAPYCTEKPEGEKTQEKPALKAWAPGVVQPSLTIDAPAGFLDLRGPIHAHSVYSHDACDGQPVVDGVYDEICAQDFRQGLCTSQQDFIMLTDHIDSFRSTAYPDVFVYREAQGDRLLEREGQPVASWLRCPDGRDVLVMAGLEGATMPVGLKAHVPEAQRTQAYGEASADSIALLHAQDAVVLVSHTEGWSVEKLLTLPLDGFEMFNLHAAVLSNIPITLQMVFLAETKDAGLPHPALGLLPLMREDPRYLRTWGAVLATGVRRVTTMGIDAHRNTFPTLLGDGDRIDSYRRMMMGFSNHLLVIPEDDGSWDDEHLRAALSAGRLYGVFEVMGYAEGFDFRAEDASGKRIAEMGDEVALADAPMLKLIEPRMRSKPVDDVTPSIWMDLLRAVDDGDRGWELVASDTGTLEFSPVEAGAYRAVVWMIPNHLAADMGDFVADAQNPKVWVYTNPIYVRP